MVWGREKRPEVELEEVDTGSVLDAVPRVKVGGVKLKTGFTVEAVVEDVDTGGIPKENPVAMMLMTKHRGHGGNDHNR